jgi:hypothetical protein
LGPVSVRALFRIIEPSFTIGVAWVPPPLNCRRAGAAIVAVPLPKEPVVPRATAPPLILAPPKKSFGVLSVRVPLPFLVKDVEPLIFPAPEMA